MLERIESFWGIILTTCIAFSGYLLQTVFRNNKNIARMQIQLTCMEKSIEEIKNDLKRRENLSKLIVKKLDRALEKK